jgi:hypothetical protein
MRQRGIYLPNDEAKPIKLAVVGSDQYSILGQIRPDPSQILARSQMNFTSPYQSISPFGATSIDNFHPPEY